MLFARAQVSSSVAAKKVLGAPGSLDVRDHRAIHLFLPSPRDVGQWGRGSARTPLELEATGNFALAIGVEAETG